MHRTFVVKIWELIGMRGEANADGVARYLDSKGDENKKLGNGELGRVVTGNFM